MKGISTNLLQELKGKLHKGRIFSLNFDRDIYSRDLGELPGYLKNLLFSSMPSAVVQPASEKELLEVVRFCYSNKIPMIIRGTASTGFGNVIPANGELVIDLGFLNTILEFDSTTPSVTIETGVKWSQLEDFLADKDMELFTYPSSFFSSVGAWVSTGGYGINSFGFGHIKNHVLAMRVITPSGNLLDLDPQHPLFDTIFQTEGQFGLVTRITLKVRPWPAKTIPMLVYFSEDSEALQWMHTLTSSTAKPVYLKFMNTNIMQEINAFYGNETVETKSAVLAVFEDADTYEASKPPVGDVAKDYQSSLLWHERVFPLRKSHIGSSLLASETILPQKNVYQYLLDSNRLAAKLGFDLMTEIFPIDSRSYIIMPHFYCETSNSMRYLSGLILTSLLTQMAVNKNAIPYGLGIWNTPYIHAKYDDHTLVELKDLKKQMDPENLLNPSRYFGIKTNYLNIPGLLFKPSFFTNSMKFLLATSPLWTGVMKMIASPKPQSCSPLIINDQTTTLCSRCGSCLSVCPAYRIMKDEGLTARSKIQLINRISSGDKLLPEEARRVFFCLHCHACERVCQSRLDLVNMWESLEYRIADEYGIPENDITDFMKKIEESPEYEEMVNRW